MNEFRVWCKNDNCWEKDECFLSENGQLFQYKHGSLRACDQTKHIVVKKIGKKDKNGRDIYSGDILRYHKADAKFVYWNSKFLKWGLKYLDGSIAGTDWGLEFEVCGNIHNDKDLLR